MSYILRIYQKVSHKKSIYTSITVNINKVSTKTPVVCTKNSKLQPAIVDNQVDLKK